MNKCGACGKPYKLSIIEKANRRIMKSTTKHLVGLGVLMEESKDYCGDCWMSTVGTQALGMYQKQTGEDLSE